MNIRERSTGRPMALHFSQNARSKSGSCAPSRPRRTIQSAMRSTSADLIRALPKVAGGAVAGRHRFQRRHFGDTALRLKWAARMEMATGRWIERARDLAFGLGPGGDGRAVKGVGNR